MGDRERLAEVVAALRDAELDDARWPQTASLVDTAFGLYGNHLSVIEDDGAGHAEFLFGRLYVRGEPNDEWERDYVENYLARDERLPRIFAMPDGAIRHGDTFYDSDRERRTSATYNEFLIPTGGQDMLVSRTQGAGGQHIIWTFVAPPTGRRDWTNGQIEGIRRLLPHVRHFVSVRQALAEAQALGVRSAAGLLGSGGVGIILLGRDGRVAEANDSARRMLRTGDVLTDRDGFLTAALPDDASALQRVLQAALPSAGRTGVGGSTIVGRRARPGVTVHATPLVDSADPGLASFAALVVIQDPRLHAPPDAGRLAETLDLTPAQARVAEALAAGETVKSIAANTHRTRATVRWHIRQMMEKLGCRRQTDLVRLFGRIGA